MMSLGQQFKKRKPVSMLKTSRAGQDEVTEEDGLFDALALKDEQDLDSYALKKVNMQQREMIE